MCEGNEAAVQQALALDKSKQTQAYAVLAAAICGNGKLALPMAQELSQKAGLVKSETTGCFHVRQRQAGPVLLAVIEPIRRRRRHKLERAACR